MTAYGPLTKSLHWLTAGLVACMFGLAWIFINIDDGPVKALLVTSHESIGIVLLLAGIGRIVGRFLARFPDLPATVTPVERYLARTVQLSLYAALFIVPLSGWVFANAFGDDIFFLGLVHVPRLSEKDIPLRNFAWMIHSNGGYVIRRTDLRRHSWAIEKSVEIGVFHASPSVRFRRPSL